MGLRAGLIVRTPGLKSADKAEAGMLEALIVVTLVSLGISVAAWFVYLIFLAMRNPFNRL